MRARPLCVRGRSASKSHVICLRVQVRGRLRVRSEAVWEADRPLTHTGRSNAFSREISQTAFSRGSTASPGVRERPIGLPHGLSLRTLTASQIGLSRPPTRPHRSQIGLSDRSDYVTDLTD